LTVGEQYPDIRPSTVSEIVAARGFSRFARHKWRSLPERPASIGAATAAALAAKGATVALAARRNDRLDARM